jgi:cytoskeletal protein CcmA (bactofilin family)
MLGRKKTVSVSGGTTLISHETEIVGDVLFYGNLDVEGVVKGNIVAHADKDAVIRIVGKGRVEGEIRVPNVIINGEVKGNVYATKNLELAPNSRVEGSVFYRLVEMAAGAEVNGSLNHMDEAEAAEGGGTTAEEGEIQQREGQLTDSAAKVD